MSVLPLFFLLAAVSWYWYSGARARERAVRVALDVCRAQQVQFLDGTVTLLRTRLRRDRGGQLGFQRTYRFEYSEDSASRREGFVVMLGSNVDAVGLAPASSHGPPTPTGRQGERE